MRLVWTTNERCHMDRLKRKVVAGAVAGLAVAGGGAAVAATQTGSPSEDSQAVLNDAAEQLGVKPAELSSALKKALANRVDAAVAAGRLTKEQGDELQARIQSGDFPLFAPGGRGGHHGGFGHGPGGHLDAAASYLGLSEDALRDRLHSGSTLADVAKAQGKTVDGLVDALVADEKQELEQAVKDGRLTAAQAQRLEQGLETRVRAIVNGERPERGARGFRFFGGPARHDDGPWS
jgi:hypothetical protein